jgi:excisionase family DNA binding protein
MITPEVSNDHSAERNDDADAMLTPDEAAQYLKVSTEQVRSLIRRGLLAAVNLGTGSKRPLYRIKRNALEDFLSDRSAGTTPSRPQRFKPRPPVQDFFPGLP